MGPKQAIQVPPAMPSNNHIVAVPHHYGMYFDKDGHIYALARIETGGNVSDEIHSWRQMSPSPEENTHADAALEEAKGVAINCGEIIIYSPFKPTFEDIDTPLGTTRVADSSGDKDVGSIVWVKHRGQLYIRGYAYYWESSSNRLALSAPLSQEQMIGSKNDLGRSLDSKARLRNGADGKLEFVMEQSGDYVAIPNASTPPLGVGSEMRFDAENWVDFLGAKYRKGGFTVMPEAIQFSDGTEKNEGGKIFKYLGGQWTPM